MWLIGRKSVLIRGRKFREEKGKKEGSVAERAKFILLQEF